MYFPRVSLPAIATLAALVGCTQTMPTSPHGGNEDIVGGVPANRGDFPFAVYLEERTTGVFCTGALIAPTKVLCAAHCFGNNDPPNRYDVRVGSLSKTTGGERISLSNIAIDARYNPNTFNYDFAVLTLSSAAPAGIAFAQLPPNNFAPTVGQQAQLAGWGRLYPDGPTPDGLEKVQVQVLNPNICQNYFGSPTFNPQINFCLGEPEGGRGACQGDSGGAAIVNNKTIIGISSYSGAICANSQSQSVYGRVTAALNFIRANL